MLKKHLTLYPLLLLLLACKKPNTPPKEEKIDWNKASISLMDNIRPKLYNSWEMKEVNVSYYAPTTKDIGIFEDTTLYNLATLHISDINHSGVHQANNDVTGILMFRNKGYSVGFRMMANSEFILNKRGAQVSALFEFRSKDSQTRIVEPDENYLYNLTLINENFSIEISDDGKVMIWKGLNRAIKSIRFEKR